ncbi:hypothetical protein evm_014182 [Chilo suppressalis]|nr:hypothetical protein evm_014182 [Chilo suppressalis]
MYGSRTKRGPYNGGHSGQTYGYAGQENGAFKRLPLSMHGRSGSYDRHGFRRGRENYILLLRRPTADFAVQRYHAQEDTELCKVSTRNARDSERGSRWRRLTQRATRVGAREGVEAVAIHGGKDQEERSRAVEAFRRGEKDVLVATDVASKGDSCRKTLEQEKFQKNKRSPVKSGDLATLLGGRGPSDISFFFFVSSQAGERVRNPHGSLQPAAGLCQTLTD